MEDEFNFEKIVPESDKPMFFIAAHNILIRVYSCGF